MRRVNLFLKVVVEIGEEEKPQRLGEELCRRLMKIYGVRWAELSSVTEGEES